MDMTVIPIVIGVLGTVIKGRLGNKRMSGDHLKDSIIKIGQNTERSPGDLLSLKLQGKTINLCWCEKLSKE